MTVPIHYSSHYDLTRLGYFEIRDDDRLVIAEPERWKSFDVHTHLALSYALPNQVDLHAAHPRTEHYLDVRCALDIDVYANKNFVPADLKKMTHDLTALSVTGRGMRATHTIPNLQRDMKDMGIVGCVLLPIDFPVLSNNARNYLQATAQHDELVCFGSVHPYTRNIAAKLDWQKAAGAVGVKVHPAVQLLRANHPKCMELYRLCAERDLMVLWHGGPVGIEPPPARQRCQLKYYEPAIAENPDVTFIMGHSGALQFELALDMGLRYPNLYFDSSSQGLRNIRRLLEEGPTDRILAGSDWPFYHQSLHLAKLLIATEGDDALRRKVLWENAARLFNLPD